jgi:hypothetical protein
MSRNGAEIDFILISEAVARLKVGMYGGLPEPGLIADIKKNVEKGEQRPSIEFEPQKEDAGKRVYEAITRSELAIFVLLSSTDDNVDQTHLQVPLNILKRMIRPRGSLPDQAVAAARIFAKELIPPMLLEGLAKSELYIRRKEFEDWYEKARRKRNWPSQRSRCDKNPMGRPSKQSKLRTPIIEIVDKERWSAQQHSIAGLVRLLKSEGRTASRQTVERAVAQLHRETGDHRYYYEDPRKKPDDSVWNLKTWPKDGPP